MYIILFVLLAVFMFLAYNNMRAQTHVENTGFDMMLSTLLKHDVPEISVNALATDSNYIAVDAREFNEFTVSHLKDAVWCGYDDFDIHRLDCIPKSGKVVVYCSVGYRSEKITEQLIAAGFINVSNLYGGIFEWVNEGNTVYNSNQQPTARVHAYSKKWAVWLFKGEKVYN